MILEEVRVMKVIPARSSAGLDDEKFGRLGRTADHAEPSAPPMELMHKVLPQDP